MIIFLLLQDQQVFLRIVLRCTKGEANSLLYRLNLFLFFVFLHLQIGKRASAGLRE